jgi:hypothetical protein
VEHDDRPNPYQSPQQVAATAEASLAPEVARDGDVIVLRKGAALPARCIHCNSTVGLIVRRQYFVITPAWVWFAHIGIVGQSLLVTIVIMPFLIEPSPDGDMPRWPPPMRLSALFLANVVVSALLFLALFRFQPSTVVRISLCHAHAASQRAMAALVLTGFAILVGASLTVEVFPGLQLTVAIGVAVALLLAPLWGGAWRLHNRERKARAKITAPQITSDTVWLAGAGPEFLASLPPARERR